jgi:hypothetical protein
MAVVKKTRTCYCYVDEEKNECYALSGWCEQAHHWWIWDICSGPSDWQGFEKLTLEEYEEIRKKEIEELSRIWKSKK